MKTSARLGVLVAVVLQVGSIGGCARETPHITQFEVSDSAGVAIAESRGPAWDRSGVAWSVDSEPLITIGGEEGEDPYLFTSIVGALRVAGGGVVIADGRSRELRYFDSTGVFRFSAGGQGEGPGELSSLRSLRRCKGDTLYAFDLRHRAHLFTDSGEWSRTLPLMATPEGGPPQDLSCGRQGGLLVMGWDPGQLRHFEGYYRIKPPMRLYDEDGSVLAAFGHFLGWEYIGGRGGATPRPYSRRLVHALNDGRAYIGTGDSYELQVFGNSGRLERIIRWSGPDLAFTDHDFSQFRQQRLARAPVDRRANVERELRDWIKPDWWPAYQSVMIDPAGFVWVEPFARASESAIPASWTVLTSGGRLLGGVEMPLGLRVTEIGADYVLGIVADHFGVERVELYRLARTGEW